MRKGVRFLFFFFLLLFSEYLQVSAQENKSLHIAFLTDIHVNPGAPSKRALHDIVHEINQGYFDLLILTGDLTNTGSDAELNAVKKALEQLTVPFYVIPGNHETNWSESAGATFTRLFGSDRFLLEKGKYLFAGFATGPYMKMGDGHVKEEDIHWLEQSLRDRMTPDKMLIIASHYPLKDGLDNWYKLTGLLRNYAPGFVMCGHEHRLSLHNFDNITGLMGRPTFYSGDTTGGYNIISLKNDSAFVFEKKIGIEATPFKAFSLKNNDLVKNLPVSPLPESDVPSKAEVLAEWKEVIQDSASIFTGVTVAENMLVYGNSKGEVIAWNYRDNRLLWKRQFTGSIYATPLISDRKVFVGDHSGVYALDMPTGNTVWKQILDKPVIGEGICEGKYLYQSAGNQLYKFDRNSGKMIWTFQAKGQLQGKPAIHGKVVAFGAWDRHLYCVDSTTGKLKWSWDNGHQAVLYSPGNVVPAIAENKIFIVAPDRYMTAIDLQTGGTVWRTNQYKVRESMGLSADGKTVYAKLMNDSVIAVSTKENIFTENWAVDADFGYEHNPCPILEYQGIVYAGGKNGLLVAIDPQTQQILFRFKAGNSSINKITADTNGKIWISLIEGKVIRFKLKSKK